MCSVDKMLIKGIRSFSPDNDHAIIFPKPLTLIVGRNGAVIRLAPGEAGIVDQVPSGRLVYDGRRLLAQDSELVGTQLRHPAGVIFGQAGQGAGAAAGA